MVCRICCVLSISVLAIFLVGCQPEKRTHDHSNEDHVHAGEHKVATKTDAAHKKVEPIFHDLSVHGVDSIYTDSAEQFTQIKNQLKSLFKILGCTNISFKVKNEGNFFGDYHQMTAISAKCDQKYILEIEAVENTFGSEIIYRDTGWFRPLDVHFHLNGYEIVYKTHKVTHKEKIISDEIIDPTHNDGDAKSPESKEETTWWYAKTIDVDGGPKVFEVTKELIPYIGKIFHHLKEKKKLEEDKNQEIK